MGEPVTRSAAEITGPMDQDRLASIQMASKPTSGVAFGTQHRAGR